MVHVHAPFARAYTLAERLCTSAKKKLRETEDTGCALDWHIGTTRPDEAVEDIRQRQYQQGKLQLTCCPYRLGASTTEPETWRWLSGTLLGPRADGFRGKIWSERHNKIKALGTLVREGPGRVEGALEAWRVAEERLSLPEAISKQGEVGFFDKTRTPLPDAVELIDLHLSLEPDAMSRDSSEVGE